MQANQLRSPVLALNFMRSSLEEEQHAILQSACCPKHHHHHRQRGQKPGSDQAKPLALQLWMMASVHVPAGAIVLALAVAIIATRRAAESVIADLPYLIDQRRRFFRALLELPKLPSDDFEEPLPPWQW